MNKRILIIILAAILAFPVFAKDIAMPPLVIPTAATNGYGGHHIAYTDNVFSLLVNPAAIVRTQEKSFFTLAPSIFNPQYVSTLRKSISTVSSGDTVGLGNLADSISKKEGKIALGVELREFPLSFAWVANGFGFGVWNRTFVNANIIGTHVEAHVFSDVMVPVGFGFRIFEFDHHSLDLGIAVKPFFRVWVREMESIISLTDETNDFADTYSVPFILGGTFDMGLMYRWDIGLRAGLTFNDIYSGGRSVYNVNDNIDKKIRYYVPFSMNLGVAYELNIGIFGFAVAADWRNIPNSFRQKDYLQRSALLDFGIGTQFSLIDMIKFRVGMNEMLPGFGLGFDFGPCEIDFAYYGKEFGNEPGQLSTAVIEFSVAIRPGAQKRYWPWTKRSVVGLISGVEKVEEEEEI